MTGPGAGARVTPAFRPLERADFADVARWRAAPHAAPWFEPLDAAGVESKYGPRVDGAEPTQVFVIELGGVPAGFVQHYRIADHPAYAEASGRPDAAGIDICIGDARFVGCGLGEVVIRAFLDQVAGPAYPDLEWCVVSVETAHQRSRRAFEKAGFTQAGEMTGERGPEVIYQRRLR